MTATAATPPAPTALDWFIDHYADDPVLFVREVFGVEPDPWQLELLTAYGRRDRQITVRSGHGVGKTTGLAWCTVHHLLFRFPQKTVATAPTEAQLYDALFAEVKTWISKLPEAVRHLLDVKSDRVELKFAPSESFFTVRTSRAEKPEALAGVHSEWVLLIADEASGIPEAIFEAASGSMSGHHAITILAANPVRNTGLFADSQKKLNGWTRIHISCEDSPRVSPQFIADMRERYGVHSNPFRVRVLGEFPRTDDNTIIPFEIIESAKTRDVGPQLNRPVVWGLDPARFGDDRTALAKRRGNTLLEPVQSVRNYDTMQVVGWLKYQYDQAPAHERPAEICIDVIGIGAGVVDRARELKLPVIGVNVSESPSVNGLYRNLRTELWYAGRDWFAKLDVKIPDDDDLIEELAAQTYELADSTGKVIATAKAKMKRILRNRRSPDLADAFLLTFAGVAGKAMHGSWGNASWGEPIKRNLKGIV